MSDLPANPRFARLMQTFAERLGLPVPVEGLGLELQDESLTLRILADADDGLLVEVDVGSAHNAPAAALALLHRINHVARLRHGWQVGLDEDDHIVLNTRRSIARTDAGALERLVDAGLERADSLQRLWHKALQSLEQEGQSRGAETLPAFSAGALRA